MTKEWAKAALALLLACSAGTAHAQQSESEDLFEFYGPEYRAVTHALALHAERANAGICDYVKVYREDGQIRVAVMSRWEVRIGEPIPPLTCKRPMLYTYDLDGNFLGAFAMR